MSDHFVSGLYFKVCKHVARSSGTVQKENEGCW